MRTPGIYKNVDIDEYHAEEGISSSGISLILDCPRRYWHEYLGDNLNDYKDYKKQKEKFMLGRAIHMLVLEPEKFEQTFYPMDEEVNLTTKIGKELYAKAEEEANGRQVIRAGDWNDIKSMAEAVKQHSIWNKIKVEKGNAENSLYWDDGVYKTRLRSRPDFFNDNVIIDLKTTDSIASFSKSVYNFGYHRQAAMQIDGLKKLDGNERHFAFFVVEKKAPYLTACFTLDENSIEIGRKEYFEGAATYSECMRCNVWPGYEEKFQLLTLPNWVFKKEEIVNE